MFRVDRVILIVSLLAFGQALTACADFDPDKLDIFGVNEKKKLPGERRPLFPEGVPGVTQGVPPELMKGQQPQLEKSPQIAAPAAAPERPKSQPKPRVTQRPPAQKPTEVTVQPTQPQQQPAPWPSAAPAQPPQQAQQAPWPAPAQSQPSAPSSAPWPAPPPAGTFTR